MDYQPQEFKERACAYRGCQEPFRPKTKNQIYCRSSHKVAAFNSRKLERMVRTEVRRRLKQRREAEGKSKVT